MKNFITKLITKIESIYNQIKNSRKLQIISGAGIFFVVLIALVFVWVHFNRFISTDDAYINANIVQITPQVAGRIARLDVQNNQFVKANALLFEIDQEPFKIALEKARAQLNVAQAVWQNAQINTKRIIELTNKKVTSIQERDDALKNLQIAAANYQLAKAALDQAELDLKNTRVFAAADGSVTNMSLRVGNVVSAYQPLFVLINNSQFWTDANFKETELQRIHSGQKTKIVVDMYPSQTFWGVVESISGGSGTAFSLLPPQNATGNWIKVTQRVPVKIRILNPNPKFPLRIGTTATVTIDTRGC